MEPNLESRLENIEDALIDTEFRLEDVECTLIDISETLNSINETFKRITNREAGMRPAYGRYDMKTGKPISETYIFTNNPGEIVPTKGGLDLEYRPIGRVQFDWSNDSTLSE